MSKAGRQTVALLSIVLGTLDTIVDFDLCPEYMPTALYAKDVAFRCATEYPVLRETKSGATWIFDKVQEYDKWLLSLDSEKYTAAVLSQMCVHIMIALQEKVTAPHKLEMLAEVWEAVDALHQALDPVGRYDASDRVEFLVSKAYSILGFVE